MASLGFSDVQDSLLNGSTLAPGDSPGEFFTNDPDLLLFQPYFGPEKASEILRIKMNDPTVTRLEVELENLGATVEWALFGKIVGQARHLKSFSVRVRDLNWRTDHILLGEELALLEHQLRAVQAGQFFSEFCPGLRRNQSIERFSLTGVHLRGFASLGLKSSLIHAPKLKTLSLIECHLDSAAIDLLSSALLERNGCTLQELDLTGNPLGDIDLDKLALAMKRNQFMTTLRLSNTGIGSKSCASFANLLRHPLFLLRSLYLDGNSLDDEAVAILVDSLEKSNIDLKVLYLNDNDGITSAGWSKMLNLVCNSSSIEDAAKSNHTLNELGLYSDASKKAIELALGIDDANLLRATLESNKWYTKAITMRRKILWSHARGDMNIGESAVANGVLPRIMSWIGSGANEIDATDDFFVAKLAMDGIDKTTNYVQYHEPPLPTDRIGTVRFDAIYRILRSRPNLCG